MFKGFGPDKTEITIAIITKRLKPSADRQDLQAFEAGSAKMIERYGSQAYSAALLEMAKENDWIFTILWKHAEAGAQSLGFSIQDESYSLMAEQLEKAGLDLAQNFRVCDQGFQLTRAAFEALNIQDPKLASQVEAGLAEELDGLPRPYIHPLSKVAGDLENDPVMNSWGFASLLINISCGFFGDDHECGMDHTQTIEALEKVIMPVAPTLDLKELVRRAKYDDRALVKLFSLAVQGIEKPLVNLYG